MEMSCQAWLMPSLTNWHLRYPLRNQLRRWAQGTGEVRGKSQPPPTLTLPQKSSELTFPGRAGLPGKAVTHFQPCLERAQWVGLLERLTVGLRQALAGSGSQKKTSVGKRLREGSAACFPYICPPSPLASDPLSHTLGPPPHLKHRLTSQSPTLTSPVA